mmetsp:Transcript_6358/g.14085  ORF Transcript_6358/g.14085 Transcript_6358/m.14085 type:complete len:292 (-) Transcript_6358:822-1697(-)
MRPQSECEVVGHTQQLPEVQPTASWRQAHVRQELYCQLHRGLVVCPQQHFRPLGRQPGHDLPQAPLVVGVCVRQAVTHRGGVPLLSSPLALQNQVRATHQLGSEMVALTLRPLHVVHQAAVSVPQVRLVGVEDDRLLLVVLAHQVEGHVVDGGLEEGVLRVHHELHAALNRPLCDGAQPPLDGPHQLHLLISQAPVTQIILPLHTALVSSTCVLLDALRNTWQHLQAEPPAPRHIVHLALLAAVQPLKHAPLLIRISVSKQDLVRRVKLRPVNVTTAISVPLLEQPPHSHD